MSSRTQVFRENEQKIRDITESYLQGLSDTDDLVHRAEQGAEN